MESAEKLRKIDKDNEERMKDLDIKLETKLLELSGGMTKEDKFKMESQKLQATENLWSQKMGQDHKERMKMLDIAHAETMQSIHYKGEFALSAINKKGIKSFRMKNSALRFQGSDMSKATRRFKPHGMISMDAQPEAIKYEQETEVSVSSDHEEDKLTDVFDEFEFEIDADIDKMDAESQRILELEKLKLERAKLEAEGTKDLETLKVKEQMAKAQEQKYKTEMLKNMSQNN